VAKLLIPRLGTSLYVVEGTDDRDLKRGPGHLTGSVMPGADGNCVIAGHRDTHFSVLKNIQKGDQIVLERAGKTFRYRVDGLQIVTPDNTESLQPTKDAVLHLITCYPFHYIGAAPKRFIVHAELEDSALSAAR
jgi:sortase A